MGHALLAIAHANVAQDERPAWNDEGLNLDALRLLQFGILVSGFPTRAVAHKGLVGPDAEVPVPSLHVWGEEDELVPPTASAILFEQFAPSSREKLVHPGGHCVPQKKNERERIVAFVSGLVEKRGAQK